ncbi:CRISPR-associated protein [Dysgonamonadaceae bacterium]|nr:CRISPR-associated protein [Dysgonamonadaceae bacterium]
MLINLTNHPFSEWDETQKNTAISLFGEVVDIPFPTVPPEADSSEIKTMTDEYLQKIKTISINNEIVVHIMGEMTFCFALIQKLQKENIKCVASTTERKVRYMPTGERVIEFNFIQFREYNNISQQ